VQGRGHKSRATKSLAANDFYGAAFAHLYDEIAVIRRVFTILYLRVSFDLHSDDCVRVGVTHFTRILNFDRKVRQACKTV